MTSIWWNQVVFREIELRNVQCSVLTDNFIQSIRIHAIRARETRGFSREISRLTDSHSSGTDRLPEIRHSIFRRRPSTFLFLRSTPSPHTCRGLMLAARHVFCSALRPTARSTNWWGDWWRKDRAWRTNRRGALPAEQHVRQNCIRQWPLYYVRKLTPRESECGRNICNCLFVGKMYGSLSSHICVVVIKSMWFGSLYGVSELGGWVGEWVDGWMVEWVSEWMNGWVS